VPPKADPRDWDRYFRPGAPRRGGPLRILANLLLIFAALGIFAGAGIFAWNFGRERARESAAANASKIETSNAAVIATREARATATVVAQVTATAFSAPTATHTPEPLIGSGSVTNGGNLRSEPLIAPETVIGQICVGDQIDFLQERTLDDGGRWYRIRVIATADDCTPERVTIGSEGWASTSLLSEPTR
jgi:Flp pilus assembly protein CpaB